MIRLATLDPVLRLVRGRMVGVAIDLEIAGMDANDRAADAARLGIPAYAIMDLEALRHVVRSAPPPFFLEQREHPNGCALYRFPDVAVFTRLALLVFGTARMDNAGASCILGRSGAALTNIFFTIGHSTRTIVEFAELLRESGADFVIDVRSIPRSRTNPQFNRETLQGTLEPWQIGYEHIAELGGRRGKLRDAGPSPNSYWRVQSFQNYADYALTAPFAAGLARLRERGGRHRCAVMCAEAVWWRCHRRIIADYLLAAGEQVMHILGKSHVDVASFTPGAFVRNDRTVVYPAQDRPPE